MAKNSVYDWDATAANNTDVGGVGITGNSLPSNLDDGMRTLMAQIKSWSTSLGLSSGDQVAKLGSANTFTATQTIRNAGPTLNLEDTSVTDLAHRITSFGDDLTIHSDINGVDSGAIIDFRFGSSNGTSRMSLNSSGGLVVGAAVYAGSNEFFFGNTSSNDKIGFDDSSNQFQFFADGSLTGSTLVAAGIQSQSGAGTGINGYSVSAGGRTFSRDGSGTQTQVGFMNANGTVGGITTNGTSTTYGTTSDEIYKIFNGTLAAEDAIAVILADPVRTWEWVPERGGGPGLGWGAQTSFEISPDLASEGGWYDFDGNPAEPEAEGAIYFPWYVDLGRRTPYLWAAVTELLARDEAKTQTISDLQTRLAALEAGA